jgi:phosphonate transport system substrate-binding protein
LVGGLLALFPFLAWGTAGPPLKLGVLPYTSAFDLLSAHQPLCDYLRENLHRPVQIYTGSDYAAFVRDSDAGDYDLLLTAPHMGRLAQLKAGYVPLLRYAGELQLVLVVTRDSPVHRVSDLAGKAIAAPDRMALATMRGLAWLKEQGLTQGRDYRLVEASSHANAILSLTRGESRAALTSRSFFARLPENTRDSLRILAASGGGPHLMFLAHPRLSPGLVRQIVAVLTVFANEAPEGAMFRQAGQRGLEPVSEGELKRMDSYARELSTLLEARP